MSDDQPELGKRLDALGDDLERIGVYPLEGHEIDVASTPILLLRCRAGSLAFSKHVLNPEQALLDAAGADGKDMDAFLDERGSAKDEILEMFRDVAGD